MTFWHWPDGLQSLALKGRQYVYQISETRAALKQLTVMSPQPFWPLNGKEYTMEGKGCHLTKPPWSDLPMSFYLKDEYYFYFKFWVVGVCVRACEHACVRVCMSVQVLVKIRGIRFPFGARVTGS